MMFGLLDWVKIGGGVIVGAALMTVPACMYGQRIQRQATAVESLTTSVEALRSRNAINGEVSSSAAADMCRSYGLSDENLRECMRRVVDADAGARNGR